MMFSASELSEMRATQDEHMMDTCKLQACVETENSFGELVQTWPVDGDAIACGLDTKPGLERHGPEHTIVDYDATLRLPIATTMSAKDRVKITKRFGEALDTALVYDIVGPIQRGPSGIRVLLKRTET
jgi:hypothetical protein